jgi:uncharacterized protein (UPF0332 family)
VAILNPDHLFDQADRLIASQAGRPRQADIRRAISSAYYGLFHGIITAAADLFVGVTNRDESRYGLVYRSVGHDRLRDLCKEAKKQTPADRLKPYVPKNGFGADIGAFAQALLELQEKRHDADYNVMIRMNRSDATLSIRTARAALARFANADETRRIAFLSLLLFQPRSS